MVPPVCTTTSVVYRSKAGLVGPFSGTQLTLDVHLSSFAQVFTGHFRQFAEQHHAVPFRSVLSSRRSFYHAGFRGIGQRNAGHSAAVGI